MPYKDKNDPRYKAYRRRRSKAVTEWRRDTKRRLVAAMGGQCVCCGYSHCVAALELHHRDPFQKDFSVATTGNCRSKEEIAEEAKKCVLVCSNCHREIHANCRELPDSTPEFNEEVFFDTKMKRMSEAKTDRLVTVEQRRTENENIETGHEIKLPKLHGIDIQALLLEHSGNKSTVAKLLGVSVTAIRKRLKKLEEKDCVSN